MLTDDTNFDLTDRHVVVTGGTGSLGSALVERLIGDKTQPPASVTVFSRDESKQHDMRLRYLARPAATDEVIFDSDHSRLRFHVGDVRDRDSVRAGLRNADVVIHAAALKQVPTCERFPSEAFKTNVEGTVNVIEASAGHVERVIGVSTDKACEPTNVLGMTKALMERLLVQANVAYHDASSGRSTTFAAVRYGNVLASRGSVIPLFLQQLQSGTPLTITSTEMTRFFMSLHDAVDAVLHAVRTAGPGEIGVSPMRAAKITDLIHALGGPDTATIVTGVRPGEKLHESLIGSEEWRRTVRRGNTLVVRPMLAELASDAPTCLEGPYVSSENTMTIADIAEMLHNAQITVHGASQ